MTTSTYPVHVDAQLDPRLSRGLWLVKWLLAIPHYVVLLFLWAAFAVMSVVAFFAILFTGRYPRAVFDFNVGVMRWTWRVTYYAYGALATDQYPPFSLRERPDYPAHLEIDYPEHLSRGLVLVKWWLLAIPHYLIVGVLLGGGIYLADDARWEEHAPWASTGLIGLLVLVAAVALLFTGRYPQSVFDLVLGLNRWVLRVAAYAGLMTDRYPPFRLDQGGHEPDSARLVASSSADPPPAPATTGSAPPADPARPQPSAPSQPSRSGWTGGRVTALVVASLLVLASVGLVVGGTLAAWADDALRDDDGYVMTGSELLTTPTYAITSEPFEIHVDNPAGVVPDSLLGTARLSATSPTGAEIFLGVAPTTDVDRYLADVAHARLMDLDFSPSFATTDGGAPGAAPGDVDIWRASGTGAGEVTVTWPLQDGDWTLVAMNADASPGVEADVAAGATLPMLDWVAPVMLVVGGTGLVLGVIALVLTILSASRAAQPPRRPETS